MFTELEVTPGAHGPVAPIVEAATVLLLDVIVVGVIV